MRRYKLVFVYQSMLKSNWFFYSHHPQKAFPTSLKIYKLRKWKFLHICICCIAESIMISTTTVIQYIYKYKTHMQTQADSVVSATDFGRWWHEKRDTILTMLTPPPRNARCILWCLRSQFIPAGRDPKNLTATAAAATVENSTPKPPWSNLNWVFFKILKFSRPSLPGMTSSTLEPHFLSGGFIMTNGDCHILCARA